MSIQQNSFGTEFMRLFSGHPLPLYWGGWHTTTYDLTRTGWKLMAHNDYDAYIDALGLRLAAQSPDGHVVITGYMRASAWEMKSHGQRPEEFFIDRIFAQRMMEMQHFQARDQVLTMESKQWSSMERLREVDMTKPFDIDLRTTSHSLSSLKLFHDVPEAANDIYIPADSVDECLNRILQLQYPEQKKIKSGLVLPNAKPIITAKILTLVA